MRKVELTILAKDFEETNYFNYSDCVITRALNRAGFIGYEDEGPCIVDENDEKVNVDTNEYKALSMKVQSMYGIAMGGLNEKPQDFTHILTFLDLEEE